MICVKIPGGGSPATPMDTETDSSVGDVRIMRMEHSLEI